MAVRKVLVLGSGRVCPPLVEYLTRDGSIAVTVASNELNQAQDIASFNQNTCATLLDVHSDTGLSSLVKNHNLVVSLVPNTLHPLIANHCIAHKVNMVTSSYVSPEMASLDQSAIDAGICILNECGLDPGIDHMLSMRCIDETHQANGKVTSFESWCGGLPHYTFANNPLKYKFSWSPYGALVVALNPAKYLMNDSIVEVPPGGALLRTARRVNGIIKDSPLSFEVYPNRNSLMYQELYGIQEAHTVIRGTIRYEGYCHTMRGLLSLGLLSTDEMPRLQSDAADLSWNDLIAMLISQTDIRNNDLSSCVLEAVSGNKEQFTAIQELGLLSDEPVDLQGTPLKALSSHLEKQLVYSDGQFDTVILHKNISITNPTWGQEKHSITLHVNGRPNGITAMSKLVGTPAAIASKMILNGQINRTGIIRPLTSDIYLPILKALDEEGIKPHVSITKM